MVQKLGAYARLLRLSNGPTAVADVWMGYAVASGELAPSWALAFVTLASLCLYHGGMALNDCRDAKEDTAEERDRPIATGLISFTGAHRVATTLLRMGLLLAIAAGATVGSYLAAALGLLLLAAIVAYNGRLKRTVAGPFLMGACRGLNGLLGMSLASGPLAWATVPPGIFAYVVGLTLFARDERETPYRPQLVAGATLSLVGIASLALSPKLLATAAALAISDTAYLFWSVTALIATRGMAAAILQPTPKNIGRGVGIAIQGLIVIDATLATLYAGPMAGLAILALLPITMLLARSIPQT